MSEKSTTPEEELAPDAPVPASWEQTVREQTYLLEGKLADSLEALDESPIKDPAVRYALTGAAMAAASSNLLFHLRISALQDATLSLIPEEKRGEVKKLLGAYDAFALEEVKATFDRLAHS